MIIEIGYLHIFFLFTLEFYLLGFFFFQICLLIKIITFHLVKSSQVGKNIV